MCGIAGFVDFSRTISTDELRACVTRMSLSLEHRGPDESGLWVDAPAGIAFGHRRLSIIDLSPAGSQPMISESGRYIIIFNGEIYNFQELRTELESSEPCPRFRGHSDTEVMLAAFERWGVKEAVRRFNGMFAFALFDCSERKLYLARDRLGEKPLYYAQVGNIFLFASELKALRAHPGFNPEIDRGALALLLRHCYIPSPYSIYQGVVKLAPAALLTLDVSGEVCEPKIQPYWSAREAAERGCRQLFAGSDEEAAAHVEALLRESVRMRMVADVPLGAFLSGGIDSSLLVAMMQAQSTQPVKTFTVGFTERQYNEAKFAKGVAQHLLTEHTELYVTPDQAMQVIPRLPMLYDEPFADSSQVPTFLVSQLARRHVTVSLSGDGGDEVFGGYTRYLWAHLISLKLHRVPPVLKLALAKVLRIASLPSAEAGLSVLERLLPNGFPFRNPADKFQRLAQLLASKDPAMAYLGVISHWQEPSLVVLGASEPPTAMNRGLEPADLSDIRQQMMLLDTVTYLPDDILTKVDRASMGVSLESRAPFLDHRLVELAWTLPLAMKFRRRQGKWILRRILSKYVPERLFRRPKSGFGIPIYAWLRGPLRDWAETYLDESRLRQDGYFDPLPIRRKWAEHVSGKRNWFYMLWSVLMFEAWLEQSRHVPELSVPASGTVLNTLK